MKNKEFNDIMSDKEENLRDENFVEQEETTEHTNELTDATPEDLSEENTALKKELKELNEKNLRVMAEFDNYRKRTLKERTDLLKTASERVLIDMLPLIDDFERALKSMETAKDIKALEEGVELIYEKFIAFLSQNGVKEIPTQNETFDTDFHEAVTTFETDDEEMKGKIIDSLSKGYTLNDKVIRFSKVVVGK